MARTVGVVMLEEVYPVEETGTPAELNSLMTWVEGLRSQMFPAASMAGERGEVRPPPVKFEPDAPELEI
jgi:hypothetical protein